MSHESGRRGASDEGLGLIELIVAIAVSGIVLVAIAMIFVNSWRAQEQVTSVTAATNRGQLVGSMFERAVRNALFIDVEPNRLRVHTSLDGSLECQGFSVSSGNVAIATAQLPAHLPGTFPDWDPPITVVGSGTVFSESDGVVTFEFDVETDAAPVRIAGQVAVRSTLETDSGGCW